MIDHDEFNYVLDKLNTFNEMGDNIRWWGSNRDLYDFDPMGGNDYYLHALIIGLDGRTAYTAIWDANDLLDNGWTEEEIRDSYQEKYGEIDLFIDEYSDYGDYNEPEWVDGRKYFNIPYNKPINESEDFFDIIRDDSEKPVIIPGGIIDTLAGNFSQYEILKRLDELGYTWSTGDGFFIGDKIKVEPYRYIFLGPMRKKGVFSLPENMILHDDDLKWIEEAGLSDLIYRT